MPLGALDKLEIQELAARYNRAVDSRRPDEWADTFTEDGVFVSMRVGTHSGRAALVKFASDFWTEPDCAPWRGGQHWAANMIIEGDGDHATLFCYHIMFMPRDGDHVESVIMAAHDDELVRTAQGWRFKVRRVIPWPPKEVEAPA
jgi:hypothetical protein